MPHLEEELIATVDALSQTAARATQTPDDAIAWLCEVSQVAAESTCATTFAAQGVSGLARTLGVSHGGLGVPRGERLHVKLFRAAGDSAQSTDLPLDDGSSALVQALGSASPLRFENDRSLGESLRSAVAIRLGTTNAPFGVLFLAHHQTRNFADAELALLQALSHQVCAVWQRTSAQDELKRQSAILKTMQSSMESGLIIMSPDGYITEVNAAASNMTGFGAEELIGRSLWSALLVSEDLQQVKQSFARLQKEAATERFESYVLTKVGARRRVSWSISQLAGDAQSEAAIVCTGVDITDRCEAVERAVRAESATVEARNMFAELQERIRSGEQQMSASHTAQRLPNGVGSERRARARREYPYVQMIAPLYGDRAPQHDAFAEMKCHDISSRGFAFVTRAKPNFDKVVVAFGTSPRIVHLTADVRHVTPKSGTSPQQYIVGCRYTGRTPRN